MFAGSWPTWRPGGAGEFAATESAPDDVNRVVFANASQPLDRRVVHESRPGEVIAPRVPHYALWAPDGSRLAYVTPGVDQLAIGFFDAASRTSLPDVLHGAPIFSSWSVDSRYLACHAGLLLQIIDAATGVVVRTVSNEASGFRVAACGPHGTLAYGVPRDGSVHLRVSYFENEAERDLGAFNGGLALAFRPGQLELAAGVTRSPQTGAFDELWVIDIESGRRRLISRGPYVAFYWSPGGDCLALVAPSQTGDGRHYVRLISIDGAQLAATEAFVPSGDFRVALGFFDQYGLSQPVWTDGGTLVLAGRRVDDSVHATLGDPTGDVVFRWRAGRGEPLELVCAGQLAVGRPL